MIRLLLCTSRKVLELRLYYYFHKCLPSTSKYGVMIHMSLDQPPPLPPPPLPKWFGNTNVKAKANTKPDDKRPRVQRPAWLALLFVFVVCFDPGVSLCCTREKFAGRNERSSSVTEFDRGIRNITKNHQGLKVLFFLFHRPSVVSAWSWVRFQWIGWFVVKCSPSDVQSLCSKWPTHTLGTIPRAYILQFESDCLFYFVQVKRNVRVSRVIFM